ncbi:MAG: hypothetical protein PHT30_05170 [Bacilli bacterium]|nr:hypothetical protein [Bacilli bacterium]
MQLQRLAEGQQLSIKHLKYFQRAFKHHRNLQAFDIVFNELSFKDKKQAEIYIYALSPAFVPIVKNYRRKATLYQAYLAYLLSKYPIDITIEEGKISAFLLKLVESKSIYARENALRALAMFARAEDCVKALDVLAKNEKTTQVKLLTETLNNFRGDKEKYIALLLNNFKKYSSTIKVAILNYVRLVSDTCKDKIYALLRTETNEEVLFACLRYFMKYRYDEAFSYILQLGYEKLIQEDWGFVAVIALVMKNYSREKVLDFLGKAVTCKDWSCRENAAKTLIDLYGNQAMTIVKSFQDKYANEMVQYQIDALSLKKGLKV